VRIDDETKGQKQAPIDPKQERRMILPNSTIKLSSNKFNTASKSENIPSGRWSTETSLQFSIRHLRMRASVGLFATSIEVINACNPSSRRQSSLLAKRELPRDVFLSLQIGDEVGFFCHYTSQIGNDC